MVVNLHFSLWFPPNSLCLHHRKNNARDQFTGRNPENPHPDYISHIYIYIKMDYIRVYIYYTYIYIYIYIYIYMYIWGLTIFASENSYKWWWPDGVQWPFDIWVCVCTAGALQWDCRFGAKRRSLLMRKHPQFGDCPFYIILQLLLSLPGFESLTLCHGLLGAGWIMDHCAFERVSSCVL